MNAVVACRFQHMHVNLSDFGCVQIASLFPKSWFTDLSSDSTIPQLQSFCRYLMACAKQLDELAVNSGKITQQRNAR